MPLRILVLIVPKGSFSFRAISLWLRPLKRQVRSLAVARHSGVQRLSDLGLLLSDSCGFSGPGISLRVSATASRFRCARVPAA